MYLRPRTLRDAVEALAAPEVGILAGGTDFYPALGERRVSGTVLDLTAIPELRGIETGPERIRIGAATTWTEVIRAPLPRAVDALKAAAREVGSVQIQNRATVAGNLCNASPAADGVPPLLALDAEVELLSARGERRVPLASFITGNRKTVREAGEIVTAILLPRTIEGPSANGRRRAPRGSSGMSGIVTPSAAFPARRPRGARACRARASGGARRSGRDSGHGCRAPAGEAPSECA